MCVNGSKAHSRRAFSCVILLMSALGGAWFLTAIPTFESSAEILVLKTEGNVLEGKSTSEQRTILDVMPTYQKILVSDAVLEGAIKKLPVLHRIDLKGVPKSKRPAALRGGDRNRSRVPRETGNT